MMRRLVLLFALGALVGVGFPGSAEAHVGAQAAAAEVSGNVLITNTSCTTTDGLVTNAGGRNGVVGEFSGLIMTGSFGGPNHSYVGTVNLPPNTVITACVGSILPPPLNNPPLVAEGDIRSGPFGGTGTSLATGHCLVDGSINSGAFATLGADATVEFEITYDINDPGGDGQCATGDDTALDNNVTVDCAGNLVVNPAVNPNQVAGAIACQ